MQSDQARIDSSEGYEAPIRFNEAVLDGDLKTLKELLKNDPDLVFVKDDKGKTPLHNAACLCREDVAALLLASGADINAKDNKGMTPLHWAAITTLKAGVAALLLRNKADVNARDERGASPLGIAARNVQYGIADSREFAKVLREHGGPE